MPAKRVLINICFTDIQMDFNINGMDLMLVALAVLGYAAGATLWAYFALPRRNADSPRSGVAASN